MSRRRCRCSSPSSRSSERCPRSGARTAVRPLAMVLRRSAANSAFSDGASEMKTISPTGTTRRVKVPPSSRRQRSISATGRAIIRAACSGAGSDGRGGRAMRRIYSAKSGKTGTERDPGAWARVARCGGHARRPEAPLLRQGPRGLRGRRRPGHGRLGPDLGLRRDPADADPRQGQGPEPDVALLVRVDRRHRPQPLPLHGRPARGRGPGDAGAKARHVPGRVRRPRVHHRVGMEGVQGDGRGLRHRAARGPAGVPAAARADLHARRRRPSWATTTRTSTSTAPPS